MNLITVKLSPKSRAYGLVWPILGRLGRLDPSSNLGTPTIIREARCCAPTRREIQIEF